MKEREKCGGGWTSHTLGHSLSSQGVPPPSLSQSAEFQAVAWCSSSLRAPQPCILVAPQPLAPCRPHPPVVNWELGGCQPGSRFLRFTCYWIREVLRGLKGPVRTLGHARGPSLCYLLCAIPQLRVARLPFTSASSSMLAYSVPYQTMPQGAR